MYIYFGPSADRQVHATIEPGDAAGSDGRYSQGVLCDGRVRLEAARGGLTRGRYVQHHLCSDGGMLTSARLGPGHG